MDRKTLESMASKVTNLRGLLGIPSGLLFIVIGLGNLGWEVFDREWAFVALLLVLVATVPLINRFYDERYGKVALHPKRKLIEQAMSFGFVGIGLVGGVLLDFNWDVEISPMAILFGSAMLAWYALVTGLNLHHYVLWGALIVIGLIPMWGTSDDKSSFALLVVGAITMLSGLFDHLTLARSFGGRADDV